MRFGFLEAYLEIRWNTLSRNWRLNNLRKIRQMSWNVIFSNQYIRFLLTFRYLTYLYYLPTCVKLIYPKVFYNQNQKSRKSVRRKVRNSRRTLTLKDQKCPKISRHGTMRKVIIIGRKNGLLFSSSSILHNIQFFREFHHDTNFFSCKCQTFVIIIINQQSKEEKSINPKIPWNPEEPCSFLLNS